MNNNFFCVSGTVVFVGHKPRGGPLKQEDKFVEADNSYWFVRKFWTGEWCCGKYFINENIS